MAGDENNSFLNPRMGTLQNTLRPVNTHDVASITAVILITPIIILTNLMLICGLWKTRKGMLIEFMLV